MIVTINFRDDENGISSIRGYCFSTSSFHNFHLAAATTKGTSVLLPLVFHSGWRRVLTGKGPGREEGEEVDDDDDGETTTMTGRGGAGRFGAVPLMSTADWSCGCCGCVMVAESSVYNCVLEQSKAIRNVESILKLDPTGTFSWLIMKSPSGTKPYKTVEWDGQMSRTKITHKDRKTASVSAYMHNSLFSRGSAYARPRPVHCKLDLPQTRTQGADELWSIITSEDDNRRTVPVLLVTTLSTVSA